MYVFTKIDNLHITLEGSIIYFRVTGDFFSQAPSTVHTERQLGEDQRGISEIAYLDIRKSGRSQSREKKQFLVTMSS